MLDAETFVCLSAKHTAPAMSIRTALNAVSRMDVVDSVNPPTIPKLKISSSAPKIIPLIPASDNSRFVVSE